MNHRDTNDTENEDRFESKSIHPLLSPNKNKAKRKPEDLLMEALHFTQDELKLNQEGYMSERQYNVLYERRTSWLIGVLLLGCLLIILFVAISFNFPHVVVGIGVFYCGQKWLMFNSDLSQRRSLSIEGRISLDIGGNKGQNYTLMVENEQFSVNKNVLLAFKNGDPYRIFYTPYSKHLLSAEWLRD
jgi:hypothetical protein